MDAWRASQSGFSTLIRRINTRSYALQELLNKKQNGLPIAAAKKAAPSNVVDLMSALKASISGGSRTTAAGKPAKAAKKSKARKAS